MASVKVAVRVRPFNKRERLKDSTLIVQMRGQRTALQKPARPSIGGGSGVDQSAAKDDKHDFTYDYSYWSFNPADPQFATQAQVYEDLGKDVIDCAFQGYNACVFAYGQTGSGKTYTMMGTPEDPGLIPLTCRALFARQRADADALTGYRTTVSYLEIYNEKVKDLLDESRRGHVLRIREHPGTGPYVENLSQHPVSDYPEIQAYIDRGNGLRTTASTNMNDTSSRSHAIFTITFSQAGFIKDMPSETVSKIHLVDLAGSERAVATGATGQRLKEGAHINKSLVTLGSVISALAEQSAATSNTSASSATSNNNTPGTKSVYIPYRDSVLTWLLKDSLGGNSKTIMIAAISPADCNYTETLSTLRYANRAKNIINTPTINEDANVKLIRELREEIQKLKTLLTGPGAPDANWRPSASATRVLEDLKRKEAQEKELTDEWTEKWCEVQAILREQKALGLRMSGAGVVLDSKHPHLIGIPDDKETGVTLYSLQAGETMIGTAPAAAATDNGAARILLSGDNMLAEHCVIRLEPGGSGATIVPLPGALCWLNRVRIAEATAIQQGDLLVLGATNVFRYNNPAEAALLKSETAAGGGQMTRSTDYHHHLQPSRNSVSRLNLSRLSVASADNLLSSIICNSNDELSFVCPLLLDESSPLVGRRSQQRTPTIANAAGSSCWDVDSLKHLNVQEREMLARKESAFHEKRALEAEIAEQSSRIAEIEAQLELIGAGRGPDEMTGPSVQQLEDQLVQREIELAKCTGSLQRLGEELHALELDHYSLIVTRRRYENEALNLGKFANGVGQLQFGGAADQQRTKSLMHLAIGQAAIGVAGAQTAPHTPTSPIRDIGGRLKRLDRSVSAVAFANAEPQTTANASAALHCSTFDSASSQSIGERSSEDGGISSSPDGSDPLNDTRTSGSSGSTAGRDGSALSAGIEALEALEPDALVAASASADDLGVCSDELPVCCRMQTLRHKIAYEKATLMKNLEVNSEKRVLDEGIVRLQELQRQYVQCEKRLAATTAAGAAERRASMCVWHRDNSADELGGAGQSMLMMMSSGGSSSGVGGMMRSVNAEMQTSGRYASECATRSIHSSSNDSEYAISIPGYVLCGSGSSAHYEYEITISLDTDKWSILRRYSRFREMHLAMKRIYGDAVAQIPFPRRQIFFPQTESVAFRRRRQLEIYLRRLLVVCSKLVISPIYEDDASAMHSSGLTRASLVEFSAFFRQGVCECGGQPRLSAESAASVLGSQQFN